MQVRGKDGIGAKMDSMELEREKGITIQSAATYCRWRDTNINIIDTPGHVDFTIEVERALRVLDSAILVLCGASGVQSQTITVDRQMRRYDIPRIAFINKLDRMGANPWTVIDKIRTKLKHNAAAVQIPIGAEGALEGVVDIIARRAYYFEGTKGEKVTEQEIPDSLQGLARDKWREIVVSLAKVDDQVGEYFVMDEHPPAEILRQAIRRTTIARTFFPVFMGAAYRNVGVQLLLDGVRDYLPTPREVQNYAIDAASKERIMLQPESAQPLIGLAFKLEEGRFGQLTYVRVYQGRLVKGAFIHNVNSGKRVKVPRLVRMHANEMEDVDQVGAGEICAMFGIECSSGDTFSDGTVAATMTPMHVPDPVIALAVHPVAKDSPTFARALARFQKEDPTFRVHVDADSNETILAGMGELHLEIYLERMKREYNCPCITGKPQVAFKEAINARASFDYLHKKQSGGAGQFARVIGYIEPLSDWSAENDGSMERFNNEFSSQVVGGAVPTEFLPACEKGFVEATARGVLLGHPVVGTRMVVNDGASHIVDSNEHAFRTATVMGFRQAVARAAPTVLEPIMRASITVPLEFQGVVMGTVNRRKGIILDTETQDDTLTILADVAACVLTCLCRCH